jgi:hypothetical protein
MTLPFGKYQDVEIDQVPDQYLIWLIAGATAGLDSELVEAIHAALARSAVRKLTATLAHGRAMGAKTQKRMRVFRAMVRRLGVTEEAADLKRELRRLARLTRKRVRDGQEPVSRSRPVLRPKDGLAGIPAGSAHQGATQGVERVS